MITAMGHLRAVAAAAWEAAHTKRGKPRAMRGALAKAKAATAAWGPLVPVGSGNGKTQLPGTYRPVGPTCHGSCPYLGNGCYAQGGKTNLHQARAMADALAHARSAVVAMTVAVLHGTRARLCVSGGWALNDALDRFHAEAIAMAARAVAELCAYHNVPLVDGGLAFSYTHLPEPEARELQAIVGPAGVAVRLSDAPIAMGAIVAPHKERKALKKALGVPLVLCPAQRTHNAIGCVKCKLCWTAEGSLIVFDGEGAAKKRTLAASPMAAHYA